MTEARVRVLEDQIDEVAGRLARVEEDLRGLKKALARPHVLEILQLRKSDLESVLANSAAATEQSRMTLARLEALVTARKDFLLKRLDMAERVADLTGQSLSDAWAMGRERSPKE